MTRPSLFSIPAFLIALILGGCATIQPIKGVAQTGEARDAQQTCFHIAYRSAHDPGLESLTAAFGALGGLAAGSSFDKEQFRRIYDTCMEEYGWKEVD